MIGAAGGAAYLAQRSGGGGSSAAAARQRLAVDDVVADSRTIVVTATAAHGCSTDRTTYASGNLVVSFTNRDATGIDSVVLLAGNRIIGERERIPAGATGSFQATLQPGRYELLCPGAAKERIALSIRGAAVPAAGRDPRKLLRAGAITYGRYVTHQTAMLAGAVTALISDLDHGNLAAARDHYFLARMYFERLAPVIGGLDGDIEEGGFGPLERSLFQKHRTAGDVGIATDLLAHVRALKPKIAGMPFTGTDLSTGAMELLTGVFSEQLTGRSQPYAHYDLADAAARVEGARQEFGTMRPALLRINALLVGEIDTAFAQCTALLAKYQDRASPAGFVSMQGLDRGDLRAIAAAVQSIVEPLSRVRNKVASA
ncbi:MAG: hypothetical protein DLM58_12560 [Pseudonocardiales bacterium]|nr:MAG: hypothetical protein DLM58_12560 [Pseudonocardiales bacterium]